MNKFIFLDIDGVLNSKQYCASREQHKRIEEFKEKFNNHIAFGLSSIDPKAVLLLNNLISKTEAKLVISSSWRGDVNLQTIFELAGIVELIYGETNRLYNKCRGAEIEAWLKKEEDLCRYIIIDNNNDILRTQLNNFVHTNWKVGLTEEYINKIIKILNGSSR